jgi:predicted DsbA family dithiol-disulfide isomerase
METKKKMKVEIWSDVMCPFCYIGKRRFETAMAAFPNKDNVELVWKSFQLAPDMKATPGKNIHQYLSEHKGVSLDEAKRMNDYVTQMAAKAGLVYNFDKAVVANSFNAQRFVHFAKHNGKQNEAEEKLFQTYFADGKNIGDTNTLVELGKEIGLDVKALTETLNSDNYAEEVGADIEEAGQLGINGVPFFVFNRKYAISGAQESQTFLQALDKSYEDWHKDNPLTVIETANGRVCTPDGECT